MHKEAAKVLGPTRPYAAHPIVQLTFHDPIHTPYTKTKHEALDQNTELSVVFEKHDGAGWITIRATETSTNSAGVPKRRTISFTLERENAEKVVTFMKGQAK